MKFSRFSWSGVDLFFVLSGFLIGGILLDVARSPSYFSTFYIRRAYRIVPSYAALLLVALVVDIHYRGNRPEWLGPATIFPYYLFFFQNWWIVSIGSFGPLLLAVTWSLAVEEQFYLTLPLAVRYIPRRILWRVLLGLVLIAPLLRILAVQVLKLDGIASYVLLPCRADALSLGVLIAMIIRSPSAWGKVGAWRWFLYAAFGLVSCGGLWMATSAFQPFTTRWFELEYSLLAVIYSFLLLSVLVSPWLSWLFSFAPLRFMGTIAYGVYLLHEPLIVVLRQASLYLFPTARGVFPFLASIFAVCLAIGLATVSWNYFEKPLVKRGHRQQYWPS